MSRNQGRKLPFSVSQNFLTSGKTIERLIKRTDLNKSDTVLEIGAGKGHITAVLARHCGRVIAYEIDPKLHQRLAGRCGDNVELILGDFLQSRLPRMPYKVFANIPFSITTAIVRKLTQAERLPDAMWLIMEKGAAKRFYGLPGENINSLLIKPFFKTKIVYHFRREDFHPAPRTDVVMLEFTRRAEPDILPSQRQKFEAFLLQSRQRGIPLTKRQISRALGMDSLPPLAPTGDILYIQWLCLFRCWLRYGKQKE